jgi:F-type H+-transporting ATPase subunit gamma
MGSFDFALAGRLGGDVINDYLSGKVDEVVIIYSRFVNMARQVPESLPLLPLQPPSPDQNAGKSAAKVSADYIYEPEMESLLAELMPHFIKAQVYRSLLETSCSEHAARMSAMDNATRNCDDLIASLTLLYNKTRQASITSDLIDIVGGAEALQG